MMIEILLMQINNSFCLDYILISGEYHIQEVLLHALNISHVDVISHEFFPKL